MMTLSLCRSTLKQIIPNSFPSSKNIAVHTFHEGFENSFLGDSIDTVMDAGCETPHSELRSRIRSGDNFEGAYFLEGLERLWKKKEEELQKRNANIVNTRTLPWFADLL
jgi:hypothetical protein